MEKYVEKMSREPEDDQEIYLSVVRLSSKQLQKYIITSETLFNDLNFDKCLTELQGSESEVSTEN